MEKKHDLRFHMKCIDCDAIMPQDRPLYTCLKCNGLLMPERDEDYVRKLLGLGRSIMESFRTVKTAYSDDYPFGSGVFRYLDFILPGFPKEMAVSLREGNTDLLTPPEWLRKKVGIPNLYVKMEGQNPSGSFKDRGMCVAISEVNRLNELYPELGIKGVVCASTGDTAAAAAAYAAEIEGMKSIVIMANKKVAPGHIVQSMRLGAKLIAVKHDDGFDGAMKIASEFARRHPEYALVNSKNPYRLIGQEAIFLEILQDLRGVGPKWISIPVGNGGNLTALLMSCLRARDFGLINELPRIIIAQPEVSNTLVRWVRSGFMDYSPRDYADSVASAMNIQDPVSFLRIKRLYQEFDILAYDVSETMIQDTRAQFKHLDPHGSVAMAAALQAREDGRIKEDDTGVVYTTASDLKFEKSNYAYYIKKKNAFANPRHVVKGTVEAVEKAVGC